jgi:hypothetical protein
MDQVDPYYLYIKGYTESLRLFSGVRVVLSEDWLQGVPGDLQDYFFKVKFPLYFIPIFVNRNCYGFVVKGFSKHTPRFATNLYLPGCERIKGGETVVLVEGFKDAYVPMLACRGLHAVVVPLLTAVPSVGLMGYFHSLGCRVVIVPDNDEHRGDHLGRYYEICGRERMPAGCFDLRGLKDFGEVFDSPESKAIALAEGKRLREMLKGMEG